MMVITFFSGFHLAMMKHSKSEEQMDFLLETVSLMSLEMEPCL